MRLFITNEYPQAYFSSQTAWMPTYASLCHQGRSHTSICPRCNSAVETSSHILVCSNESAVDSRQTHIQSFLNALTKHNTTTYMVAIVAFKLSIVLDIPLTRQYNSSPLPHDMYYQQKLPAICHQNIIG
jgi:hypothetical protein